MTDVHVAAAGSDSLAVVAPAYDGEDLLRELRAAVARYLEQIATRSSIDRASTDLATLAARVRRQVERRSAEAELQTLSQVAHFACFKNSPAAPALSELADCVRAYLDARARERGATQAIMMQFQPFEDLETEVTNRIWWERDLRLLIARD